MLKWLSHLLSWKIISSILFAGFFLSTYQLSSSFDSVNATAVNWYEQLKTKLEEKGYKADIWVISTHRPQWLNDALPLAVPQSQHLQGNAIDVWVLDINNNQELDDEDIRIVYNILDKEIVGDKGGLGVYFEKGFMASRMVHFDCRGYKARWGSLY